MSKDDVLFGYRLQLFDLAGRIGVAAACRSFGIHRSTYYRRARPRSDRHGLEVLRPRERRRPRMPNQLSPLVEERIVAFALGHPGLGPRRIVAELARPRWGGIREAEQPGELVGIDCFFVGRLHGTKGTVWQLTAIDVCSSFAWAELVACPSGQPGTAHTSRLAPVSPALQQAGWRLERVLSDNGSEFRGAFSETLTTLGARQSRIHAGRPQTNGAVAARARSTSSNVPGSGIWESFRTG